MTPLPLPSVHIPPSSQRETPPAANPTSSLSCLNPFHRSSRPSGSSQLLGPASEALRELDPATGPSQTAVEHSPATSLGSRHSLHLERPPPFQSLDSSPSVTMERPRWESTCYPGRMDKRGFSEGACVCLESINIHLFIHIHHSLVSKRI